MNQVKNIDAITLDKWLKSGTTILIDVREPEEFQSGRIERAKNIPLGQITYTDMLGYKNKKIVMYCRAGVRSLLACQKIMQDEANLELYNLGGGIKTWQEAGLPVL